MRFITTACALGLTMAASSPVFAATPENEHVELEELKQQVARMLIRIEQLENAAGIPPAVASLETRVATVEESVNRQSEQRLQDLASSNVMDWARNIRWKGDLRYRHEQFDIEGVTSDRVRHRIRARLGLDASISNTVSAGFQIMTGELVDPRGSNATLDDAGRRKEIGLDLAYVDWRPRDGVLVTIGKQKMPWFKAGNSMFFDTDLNPEGVSLQFGGKTGPFGKIWGYWLEEMPAAADSNLVGAQLGYAFGAGLTLAAGYWNYGAIKEQPMLNFAGAPAGNSVFIAGPDCNGVGTTACYAFDFDVAIVDARWSGRVGTLPLMLFGGYLKNMDPDELNTGYDLGFMLGRAADPGSWEFGALYQDVERDAQFGAFYESDFADGLTQSKGIVLQGVWAPAKSMTIKATYFGNVRSYDAPTEVDYRRLQLDLNYKF